MATTITRGRLRRLAEVRPKNGRVLSVFLDLDPSEFATPPARATQINAMLTEAEHLIEERKGELSHDEVVALREDCTRIREALDPDGLGAGGTRGIAVYAWGGPDTDHDVDFMLKPEDADRALEVLEAAGFEAERPPEGWLYKAHDPTGAMIDLIFKPAFGPVGDELLARAEPVEVHAIQVRAVTPTDILASKLLALREHNVDYESVLEIARSLREQVDWAHVRAATESSPFARAFFVMLEGLEIIPPADDAPAGAPREPRVRVLTSSGSDAAREG